MATRTTIQAINEFIQGSQSTISYPYVIFAFVLAVVFSYIIGKFYIKYGTSLSNRRKFAGIFIPLSVTICFIITIIRVSLLTALSLGLVGALIRYRSAIKEPSETLYLFISIAIGLGLGAQQPLVTFVFFLFTLAIIYGRNVSQQKGQFKQIYLTIKGKTTFNSVWKGLKRHCINIDLRSLDYTEEGIDAIFLIEIENMEDFGKIKKAFPKLNISFIDKQ